MDKKKVEQFAALWESAYFDAVLYGMGVIVIKSDMTVQRVEPKEYDELITSLLWALNDGLAEKTLPKQ